MVALLIRKKDYGSYSVETTILSSSRFCADCLCEFVYRVFRRWRQVLSDIANIVSETDTK